jgi:hypothetical protein
MERYRIAKKINKEVAMRSILTSRLSRAIAAAGIAGAALFAATGSAEARWCNQWRHGHCVDWRYNNYNYNNNGNAAAALGAMAGLMAGVAASQSYNRPYYYAPPPTYGYYAPAPAYGYYAPPPAYGYYGPEPRYGLMYR